MNQKYRTPVVMPLSSTAISSDRIESSFTGWRQCSLERTLVFVASRLAPPPTYSSVRSHQVTKGSGLTSVLDYGNMIDKFDSEVMAADEDSIRVGYYILLPRGVSCHF